MKLVVRMVDGANVAGRRALVLCDENGAMLPQQLGVVIEQAESERSTVIVTFGIDGRNVILDGSLLESS